MANYYFDYDNNYDFNESEQFLNEYQQVMSSRESAIDPAPFQPAVAQQFPSFDYGNSYLAPTEFELHQPYLPNLGITFGEQEQLASFEQQQQLGFSEQYQQPASSKQLEQQLVSESQGRSSQLLATDPRLLPAHLAHEPRGRLGQCISFVHAQTPDVTFDGICPFPTCGHACSSRDDMQEHTRLHHAGQHLVVSKNPFKCHCGKEFAKLFTLERHIQGREKSLDPKYPCTECTVYQGKSAFVRKDHLVQHLKCIHGYEDDKLATIYPPRQARRFQIPVCHFEDCEYYRDPEFRNLPIGEQEKNRPFDRQSDYTAHMKFEHDWSPYPCKVPGCDKSGRKGFFGVNPFEKHCKEKHPGVTIAPVGKNRSTMIVTCDYCRKVLTAGALRDHQESNCHGKVECDYCHEPVESRKMRQHKENTCTGEASCGLCYERMESRRLDSHERNDCIGQVTCGNCSKLIERREAGDWSWRLRCPSCRGTQKYLII